MTTQASFKLRSRNPDVLTCIANLSNDEVFTPPELASQILDELENAWAADNRGENLWANKDVRFLDPCTKSGVFLREITRRLTEGLAAQIPNLERRVDHILSRQVFGVAITRLTSLLARRSVYCSKSANGRHSIGKSFEGDAGNIWYERLEHEWQNGNCRFCGLSQKILDRGDMYETHAYFLNHSENVSQDLQNIFGENMQFDVIIGNPPYQISDGGGSGTSAKPIYHQFVNQALSLQPKYLTMVIPARWYAGGKGLNEFRQMMLENKHIRKLVDFPSATDVFPGVDIAGGVCYFLWSDTTVENCEVLTVKNGEQKSSLRNLNEFPTFIRNNDALAIIKKIHLCYPKDAKRLDSRVSPRKPFGIPSNYQFSTSGVPCWFAQKIGKKFAQKRDVYDSLGALDKWKELIPFAPIAGQTDFSKSVGFYSESNTRIAKPGECCSETYLIAGAFDSESEAVNYKSYLFTKVVRFLLLQAVTSQNITRQYFYLIPDLVKYDREYSDEFLIKKWGLTAAEWQIIDERIS